MAKEETKIIDWAELTRELERSLRLRTYPIAYKRLERLDELDKIPTVVRLDRGFTFCQLPTLVRRGEGMTIGVTREDPINPRCARIFGLAATTQEQLSQEVTYFTNTYFTTEEKARRQMAAYPPISPGEAIMVAPPASVKLDPEVVLIYGTPAQMMVLMCALQVKGFKWFQFLFIGEGSCADSLAQCYVPSKPALSIPCYGERAFGSVEEDKLVLAVPPGMMGEAVEGLQTPEKRQRGYPTVFLGPGCSPSLALAQLAPR